MPWWVAVLIAATATAVGFAFDAGSGTKELTHVFAGCYVAGCLVAVLVVRQSGVFTAVIQPPLLLFCAVPGAYWLFHGGKVTTLKDTLINCGYPLIERFPLMLFTSAAVLLVGMIRWYRGTGSHPRTTTDTDSDSSDTRKAGIRTKLSAIWGRNPTDNAAKSARVAKAAPKSKRRMQAVGQASATGKSSGGARTTRRSAPPRSRHARASIDDTGDFTVERARRRRPRPVPDVDADVPPRRRPKRLAETDMRGQSPPKTRRDPHVRTGRPAARSSRFDPHEPVEPHDLPPRRRPAPEAAAKTNSTHHPISQVRYRDAGPRGSQSSAAESWEYDI